MSENGKIDVLAVIKRAERLLDREAQEAREQDVPAVAPTLEVAASDLGRARAAVAELLEAAKAMANPGATDVDLFNAQPRLRAALAQIADTRS